MTETNGKVPCLLVTGSDASLRTLLDYHAQRDVRTLPVAELERAEITRYGTSFLTAVLKCESDIVDTHPDRHVARYYPIAGLGARELVKIETTKTPVIGTIDPRHYFVSASF
ncbi:MAG TPA: hypothetical protein VJH88_03340 [Candidatus Nanoarchaeia archaeon]|nr:hypothetical protein [Candidatus Nanoarchaeia archaeon]